MATSFSPPARHTATQVPHPRTRILFAPEIDSLISLKGFLLATIIYATPGLVIGHWSLIISHWPLVVPCQGLHHVSTGLKKKILGLQVPIKRLMPELRRIVKLISELPKLDLPELIPFLSLTNDQ